MHLAQYVQLQRVGLRVQLTELEIAQSCGKSAGWHRRDGHAASSSWNSSTIKSLRRQAGCRIAKRLRGYANCPEKRARRCSTERAAAPPRATAAARTADRNRTNQPFRGRCLLSSAITAGSTSRLLPQRARKTPRLMSRCGLLQSPSGGGIFPLLKSAPGAGQNLCELTLHLS